MSSKRSTEFDYGDESNSVDDASSVEDLKLAITSLTRLTAHEAKALDEYEAIKKERRRISEKRIPELLGMLGIGDIFTLADGTTIKIKRKIRAGVMIGEGDKRPSEENKARAYQWLEQHGEGGLFKREVVVSFMPDQDVTELQVGIKKLGFNPETKLSVHHNTLEAALRRLHTAEELEIPEDIFRVWQQTETKIS